MHFLITAGPTRQYIDTVRFISNGSTGKMGYACAFEAVKRGHKVTVITGPVSLEKPKGVKVVKVVSTEEMATAVQERFSSCDCVIMTAAVCDYRPISRQKYKIQKTDEPMILRLDRTVDILAELGENKQQQILIGFAVQDKSARQNARRKLKEKNLDAIVLNSPEAIGADRNDACILQAGGKWQSFTNISKKALAGKVIKLAEQA